MVSVAEMKPATMDSVYRTAIQVAAARSAVMMAAEVRAARVAQTSFAYLELTFTLMQD